jgi:hypothetical protein
MIPKSFLYTNQLTHTKTEGLITAQRSSDHAEKLKSLQLNNKKGRKVILKFLNLIRIINKFAPVNSLFMFNKFRSINDADSTRLMVDHKLAFQIDSTGIINNAHGQKTLIEISCKIEVANHPMSTLLTKLLVMLLQVVR